MPQEILPVLYEMARVIGEEVALQPLLTRTLQRLLYFTSFPAGFICLDLPPPESARDGTASVRIDAAVGDYALLDCVGKPLVLPVALFRGDAEPCDEKLELLSWLPGKPGRYHAFLRLPIDHSGVIVLLAPRLPKTDLPLTEMFKPVMAQLAKAIVLCRSHEAYTSSLIAERDSLGQQRDLMMAVFDSSYVGIIIVDAATTTITSANPAFTAITGYASEEVTGQNPRILASGRHDRSYYQTLWRELSSNGYWQGEIWNRRKTGEVYPEWLTISTVRDKKGLVTHYVGVFSDLSERKAMEEHAAFLAHHDPLTGLPNRTLLRDRCAQALAYAAEEHRKLALLLLDINNFKDINDTLGHPVGDELLQTVGKRLRDNLRLIDTVSHPGGDEFVILLTDVAGSMETAEIARSLVESLSGAITIAGHALNISVSIGISLYPADGGDFDTLLKHADIAMYHAKRERESFSFFIENMNRRTIARFELEFDLRQAIERAEFVLHYQPVIDLASGGITGAEALIRWNSPERGLVSPETFIPLAEETGLIVEIGAWALREACRQMQSWHAAGHTGLTMSVNLSTVQIKRGDLVQTVSAALDASGLRADALELELTESIMIHDAERTMDILQKLKALGVSMALDDFGTGYSSLSRLKRMAMDKLKIDQSFVRDMRGDEDVAAIVRAVLHMGNDLRLKTTAEGIEHREQAMLLAQWGCRQGQGYYFSRPLPAEDFTALLARNARFDPR